jgi:hypothetical protein
MLFVAACCSCTQNGGTEKYQNKRNNVVNVHEKITEIRIEEPLISFHAFLYMIDKYLIIRDYMSLKERIHLFNKNTFEHVVSTAPRGQGPREITNIGHIGINEACRKLYVSDHGKNKIFSYELDSILVNPLLYMPDVKMNMNEGQFPNTYEYISDPLCIGMIIEPIGVSDFKPSIARWNMQTGEIVKMKYEHPKIKKKKRICFAVSMNRGIYVEGYNHNDLMTICSLDGNLKYNIYGPKFEIGNSNRMAYYKKAIFCGDKLLALYTGGEAWIDKGNGMEVNRSTKFLVFDMNGDYIQTLETGYPIIDFCYDSENNRILMSMNDEIQFAYLELDGLLE